MNFEKPLTKDQQIENCLLALALWAEVSPRSVRLHYWKCGTHACFGGHLATWPEFQKKGISVGPDKEPVVMGRHGVVRWPHEVAHLLFGNQGMFYERDDEEEPESYSDHLIVVRRLENQIVALSS